MIEVRRATQADMHHMFIVSVAAHIENYRGLIPRYRQEDFARRYSIAKQNEEKFINRIQSHFGNINYLVVVAVEAGRVVGYCIATRQAEKRLTDLFVLPQRQQQGIGQMLMTKALEWLGEAPVYLTVLEENLTAIQFYARSGFAITTQTPKLFYGAKQVIMSRNY